MRATVAALTALYLTSYNDIALPLPGEAVKSSGLTFVGLGEVLFDVFEDGTRTLGGAPLNVAVHAHQLASAAGVGAGVVASRIGRDSDGEHILRLLETRNMDTQYVQTDADHPTGTVTVRMQDHEPGYQIEAGAAWDFMEASPVFDQLAAKCDAVCFGSLAQRGAVSRATIQRFLRESPKAVRLYDVNLRRNTFSGELGYSLEVIEQSCRLATMMKLNVGELEELCKMTGLTAAGSNGDQAVRARVEGLMDRFGIHKVVVTLGERGTVMFVDGAMYSGKRPPTVLHDVHPVGAGDACSAGILFGSVMGWNPDDSVDLANRLGAWVASQQSATPLLPASIVQEFR